MNVQIISGVTGERTNSNKAGSCINLGKSEAGCLLVWAGVG